MAFTLHHMSHYVKDVDASAAFYMSVLGLTEIPNRIGNPKIRWFDLDGIRSIHLIPATRSRTGRARSRPMWRSPRRSSTPWSSG